MGKGGVGDSGGGGGGGGANGIGTGSAGTCFSGGSGSGGTYYPVQATTSTANAGTRGGAGSDSALLGVLPAGTQSAAGAGNPNGSALYGPNNLYDGTGGVLIVFVEGTITTVGGGSTPHFTANGTQGRQMTQGGMGPTPSIYPFGGGTGGGIVILVNNGAGSLSGNLQALGGIIANNGPSANFQSGGNGSAVAYTFAEL